MRLAGQAKGGYYPTPPRVTEYIATALIPYTQESHHLDAITLFDPCCGPGEALEQLAKSLKERTTAPIHTYGVELHHERSLEAAERLDNVLSSDIFSTAITNNTFGILFLNPPYDQDAGPTDHRTEHTFLVHSTKYLVPRGILVYIIPQKRIHHSAKYLSSQYNSFSIFKFPHPESEAFGQVVLLAAKTSRPYPNNTTERWLHQVADNPNLPPLEPLDTPLHILKPKPPSDITFITRMANPITSAKEARTHGMWSHARTTEALWPTETPKTRPLMPLRKGHMAVLMAAGFLNNLSLEADGHTVLVKGTTKKEDYLADEDEHSVTYRQRVTATITTLNMTTGEVGKITA